MSNVESIKSHTVLMPQMIERDTGPDTVIPEKFRREITMHLIKNFMDCELESSQKPPLILAIAGQPGTGKSYMTRRVCAENKIHVYYLSASVLSNKYEGLPNARLLEAYKAASKENGGRNVILIDDIDTSIISRDPQAKYTVNSQILAGALMNLCDNPGHEGNGDGLRIPIIVTGNNLSNLYKPLTRMGRMKIFNWEPDDKDRKEIIKHIFKGYPLNETAISRLNSIRIGQNGSAYPAPLSFYAQLKNRTSEDMLWEVIQANLDKPIDRIIDLCCDRTENRENIKYSLDDLYAQVESIKEEHQFINFLNQGEGK